MIPVTVEGSNASPDRSRTRLKRPSTSEPASPVPSKRSQDESGEPRKPTYKSDCNYSSENSKNGHREEKWNDSKNVTDSVSNGNHDNTDKGGDNNVRRRRKEKDCNGIVQDMETSNSANVENDQQMDNCATGNRRESRSRRNSKYEDAHEVIIPVRIDKENDKKVSSAEGKISTSRNIKIHREGTNEINCDTNKENEAPKKRKSVTFINGCNVNINESPAQYEKEISSNKQATDQPIPDENITAPKPSYYFGESPKSKGRNISIVSEKDLNENVADRLTMNNLKKLDEASVDKKSSKRNGRKSVDIPIKIDCNSSESGLSTSTLSSQISKETSSSTSTAPSTSSDYSTPKKVLTPPDSPYLIPENPLNRSPKRKISIPSLSSDYANSNGATASPPVSSKKTPVLSFRSINTPGDIDTNSSPVIAEEDDLSINLKPKRKNGQISPPSHPFGKEVKVEHRQSLMEDDMFKNCWCDYSNTLQDVLSRLQELSTELGQTPKFLVSSPTVPEMSLPGSTTATPTVKPAYYFVPTPEVRGPTML